jgi:hypothetical protein
MLFGRLIDGLGGMTTDVNADINDFNPGLYMTYGKVNSASSIDDWFHAGSRCLAPEPGLHVDPVVPLRA